MIRTTNPKSLPSKAKPLPNQSPNSESVVKNAPEGYVTGEVFRQNVKSKIFNHYKENGLL